MRLKTLLLALALWPVASMPSHAQDAAIYVVGYVEVMPASTSAGAALLKQLGAATAKDDGNLRFQAIQDTARPHRFAYLEIWKNQAAFEAHGKAAHVAEFRDKLKAIHNAPLDERVHVGLSVGPMPLPAASGAVFVLTHVDVIPPRKDDGTAAVKQLGEDGRKDAGNLLFEVVVQTNRPNHFTVTELWKDLAALNAHSAAAHTRAFRDKLGPMSGALYDERLYKAIE